MENVYINCPHCGELTEAEYDIEEVGQFENYDNNCEMCDMPYSFEITTKVSKS